MFELGMVYIIFAIVVSFGLTKVVFCKKKCNHFNF